MEMNYLRTDHWIDAIASLEAAQEFCSRVTLDEHYWKWLLISIHSAVQGFMVLALEHGNSFLVMKDELAAKWLKAYETGGPFPPDKMDYFLSLYEKVKSDDVCRYIGSKKFIPGTSHDYSMKKLNELRNDYIHFFPKGWSIEIEGLPSIAMDCLEIVQFLGFDSFTMIWHDNDLRERAQRAIIFLQAGLKAVGELYKVEN